MTIKMFKGRGLPECIKRECDSAADGGLLVQWNEQQMELTIRCEHTGEKRQVRATRGGLVHGTQLWSIDAGEVLLAVIAMKDHRDSLKKSLSLQCRAMRMKLGQDHIEHASLCEMERLCGAADNEGLSQIIVRMLEIQEAA